VSDASRAGGRSSPPPIAAKDAERAEQSQSEKELRREISRKSPEAASTALATAPPGVAATFHGQRAACSVKRSKAPLGQSIICS
jgi:hypothetical protein